MIKKRSRHVYARFVRTNTFRTFQTRQEVFHGDTEIIRERAAFTSDIY